MNAYLCAKAALSALGLTPCFDTVLHDIADFLATKEERRIDADWKYRETVKEHWAGRGSFEALDLLEYVDNPFLRMAESVRHPDLEFLARHWWSIAQDTCYNYRRSEARAQKGPIRIGGRLSCRR